MIRMMTFFPWPYQAHPIDAADVITTAAEGHPPMGMVGMGHLNGNEMHGVSHLCSLMAERTRYD